MHVSLKRITQVLIVTVWLSMVAILQEAYAHSLAAARSLASYDQPIVHTLMKWRLPGDVLIILGALVLFLEVLRGAWLGSLPRPSSTTAI
jgi:nitric oxide reductase large subunit